MENEENIGFEYTTDLGMTRLYLKLLENFQEKLEMLPIIDLKTDIFYSKVTDLVNEEYGRIYKLLNRKERKL